MMKRSFTIDFFKIVGLLVIAGSFMVDKVDMAIFAILSMILMELESIHKTLKSPQDAGQAPETV